jgi:hypothetical protein
MYIYIRQDRGYSDLKSNCFCFSAVGSEQLVWRCGGVSAEGSDAILTTDNKMSTNSLLFSLRVVT